MCIQTDVRIFREIGVKISVLLFKIRTFDDSYSLFCIKHRIKKSTYEEMTNEVTRATKHVNKAKWVRVCLWEFHVPSYLYGIPSLWRICN